MRKNTDRFGGETQQGAGSLMECGDSSAHRVSTDRQGRVGLCLQFLSVALAVMLMVGKAQAADFVLVVDVSGSMADPVSRQDKRVRVTVVQDALRNYLPALPADSRVDLIAFNSGIVSEEEVILKDKGDIARALAWVEGLSKRTGNDTHLWTTLRHALNAASKYSTENPGQPVTVRVLTDGEDNERATTMDKVLQEFIPVLDGEKIRSNLVLLGDMEFKTKLSLPEGAFETTKNPTWEVLFPPIVLSAPAEPKIGEDVRLFENNTRAIYKDYEWQVDGVSVGKEKVLTWRFTEPRSYRVMLKVTGMQGTKNSASVIVKIRDEVLTATIKGPTEIVSGRAAQFAGEIAGPCSSVAWNFGDGTTSAERNPQHSFECRDSEFKDYPVSLSAVSPIGKSAEAAPLTIRVWAEKKAPAPQAMFRILTQKLRVGDPIQVVDETTGPVDEVQWDVDGAPMGAARNPELRVNTVGEKTIRMSVRGPGGESVATKTITVLPRYTQPSAWCGASTLSGTTPLTVQFTNRVTGDYKGLVWTFGDGQTSTNSSPRHTFATATNYVVSLTVFPMDGTQPNTEQRIVIKAAKPWPVWAKVAAAAVPCLILMGIAAGLILQRRRKALRLPVYFWAEQASICQTVVLTKADEEVELSPAAHIRVKREGASRNLIVQPLDGSTLLAADGQEVGTLSVGDGLRITTRDARGLTRAVAISILQKPRRPTSAATDLAAPPEGGVCGLLKSTDSARAPVEDEDPDWGWAKAATKVG